MGELRGEIYWQHVFPLKPDYSGVVKTVFVWFYSALLCRSLIRFNLWQIPNTCWKVRQMSVEEIFPFNTKYVNLDRLKSLSLLPHCSRQDSQREGGKNMVQADKKRRKGRWRGGSGVCYTRVGGLTRGRKRGEKKGGGWSGLTRGSFRSVSSLTIVLHPTHS